jgi:type IVB pilus formation R64 PilN family outer membrane protein
MTMKTKQITSMLATVGAASILAGCAAVPESQVAQKVSDTRSEIEVMAKQQASRPAEPLFKHVKGNYIASAPVSLSYDATLPPVFRNTVMRFPGKANLATAAYRITETTRLPVRIREDVYFTAKSLASGSISANGGSLTTPQLPGPLPGDVIGVKSLANTDGISTQKVEDFDLSVPMDWNGTLSNYLDLMCNRLGVNWEYRDGTIYVFRLVTKSFPLKLNPGTIDFGSSVSKGGSATSGATGPNAQSNGSFSSTSSTSSQGKFSAWQTMEAAIKPMLTPIGKVTIDEAAGNIIVTDTKEAVSDIGRLIESQNAVYTRQLEFDVRIVRVAINNSSTADLSLNLAYNKLDAAGANKWNVSGTSPGSLTSSSSLLPGGIGARILSPTSPFSGSSLFVDALNQVGKVVDDRTVSAITTNRVPVPIVKFSSVTYLAQTTPAQGGTNGSSGGVPGLTPGSVTTGFFLNVLPTVMENNSVLMRLSLDQSTLTKMGSITTGTGETQQMIQTPNTDGDKSDHSVGLREGESLVLMGNVNDVQSHDKATSPTGLSNFGNSTKELQVIIVTPRVRPGI